MVTPFGLQVCATRRSMCDFSILKSGNAVAQQAADAVVLLEQGHIVAGARQLLSSGQASRAGTHDRHLLAGLVTLAGQGL
jgi:hypothetical protein